MDSSNDMHMNFHLILVHGISDSVQLREEARQFWTSRFPGTLLTDFALLPEHGSLDNVFLERAEALLRAAHADREHQTKGRDSGDFLPCVWVGHDMGTSLIKQALVIASQNSTTFGFVASKVATVILVDDQGGPEYEASWESDLLELLSRVDGSVSRPPKLLQPLLDALKELFWAFAVIQKHYAVVTVRSPEETGCASSSSEEPPPPSRHQTILSSASTRSDMWRFSHGDATSEMIFDLIREAVKKKLEPTAEEFHDFMRFLSTIDPDNHQLRPTSSSSKPLSWIDQHAAYREWKNTNIQAPKLLHIYGPPGCGGDEIASHLFKTIQSQSDAIVASFASQRQDVKTQKLTTLLLSFIRQLLLCQPSLFRHVNALCKWIKTEKIFSQDVLKGLLTSLLKAYRGAPIFFIIYGNYKGEISSFSQIMTTMWNNERSYSHALKVVVIDEQLQSHRCGETEQIYPYIGIDLSKEELYTKSLQDFCALRVEELARDHPHWEQCKDYIVKVVCDSTASMHRVTLTMTLLERAKIPPTQTAIAKLVESLSYFLDRIYEEALRRSEIQCCLPWVMHSVRPLTLREMAVGMALAASSHISLDSVESNLPRYVYRDLQPANGTILKLSGLQVYPIHQTVMAALAQKWQLVGEDPDAILAAKCLDYLEITLPLLATVGSESEMRQKDVLMDCVELGLVPYAVTNWPEHYKRALDRRIIKGRVLELFSKNHEAATITWFQLYQQCSGISVERYSALESLLKIACRFGLTDLVEELTIQERCHEKAGTNLSDALNLAVGHGHHDIVSLLLAYGAVSSEAMGLAASNGFGDILQLLIQAGDDLDRPDESGRPPFVHAVLHGNENIAVGLLNSGATCHAVVGTDVTTLYIAAKTGQLEIAKIFIEKGGDIEATTENGNTALMAAAAGGFDDVVNILSSKGAELDKQNQGGQTALHLAIEHGHLSTCSLFLELGASIGLETAQGLSAVHLASREGDVEMLQQLLSRSGEQTWGLMDEEANNMTGMEVENMSQAPRSAPRIAGLLFDPKAGPWSPLQLAASNGHFEVLLELLNHTRFGSERNRASALLLAASGGFVKVVNKLLESGTSAVVKDTDGNSALHLSTLKQHPDVVAQLISARYKSEAIFDINSKNISGNSPLHLAMQVGNLVSVEHLVRGSASLECVNKQGQTPLHMGVSYNHLHAVRRLLQHRHVGHIVSCEDKNHQTAFTLAVRVGCVDMVDMLIQETRLAPQALQGTNEDVLCIAARHGSKDLVCLLLDRGWDILLGGDTTTALHAAVEAGNTSTVQLLLEREANVNARDSYGKTPLHWAAVVDDELLTNMLLNYGAQVDAVDGKGTTPLWQSAYSGIIKNMEALLKRDPDVDIRAPSRNGWTALHACHDNPAVSQRLLEAGANPQIVSNGGSIPMMLAANKENGYETVQHHLNAGVDPNWANENGLTALHVAAGSGKLATVELLVSRGASIDAATVSDTAPIHLAARKNASRVVEYLLSQHANCEAMSSVYGTPLMVASLCDNHEIVELLLRANANPNASSDTSCYHTALQAAARRSSRACLRALLKGGANVNVNGGDYGSALCAAAAGGNQEIVEILLEAGENINYAGGRQGTALELAVFRGHSDVVDLLLTREADVNAVCSNTRRTPLMAAIEQGHVDDDVKKLLVHGADPNPDMVGILDSPGYMALRTGSLEVLQDLLEYGANISIQDKFGHGPVSQAILWRRGDLLVSYHDFRMGQVVAFYNAATRHCIIKDSWS